MPHYTQPTCATCGGSNLVRDATSRWNPRTRTWELLGLQDFVTCEDCNDGETRIVDVQVPIPEGTPHARNDCLTFTELEALCDEFGTVSFAAFTRALAAKRDAYDLAAVAAAKASNVEGEIEIDDEAITSRSEDDRGAYVMAWVWVAAEDMAR